MDILQDSNPLLRVVSSPITDFDDDLRHLVDTMIRTTIGKGIGLSAIQIGVTKRVIIVLMGNEFLPMINPVITRTLKREVVEQEGCLSIDRSRWCRVSRPAKCDIDYQDLDGDHHSVSLSGLEARIAQHEIDHLDGILITDKAYF